MDARDGGARPSAGERVSATPWSASARAGARIDTRTLAAAAEVNRHYAQRLEAHRRASMPAPEAVRGDEHGQRS
jgi:hypothetical protein